MQQTNERGLLSSIAKKFYRILHFSLHNRKQNSIPILAMNRDGKCRSEGRIRQKYCCPFRNSKSAVCPCNHKNRNNGKKNKGCTKYITVPDDYRLSFDRECISFKKIYSLRTEPNDTMLVSNRPVRSGFGFTVKMLQKISIPLLILLCLPLLMLLSSLNRIILFVA